MIGGTVGNILTGWLTLLVLIVLDRRLARGRRFAALGALSALFISFVLLAPLQLVAVDLANSSVTSCGVPGW